MIDITTPALLFPAISLLLLAYTNRFLVVAQLIRTLYQQHKKTSDSSMAEQIRHLRSRISLIKVMQATGVGSFMCCTLAMIGIFFDLADLAQLIFGISLVFLLISLSFALWEILISGKALNMQLEDIERKKELQNN